MQKTFDVIVAGLGAAGSAAAYHLSRRGLRVLGLDRFDPPHPFGSSHGGSRIIRRAYFEGPRYAGLLARSYALWRALEREAGRPLFRITGGLMIGEAGSRVLEGSRRTAEAGGIAHEMLSARAVAARFPAFRLPSDHEALLEPEAGLLDPEACIAAHLEGARRAGAVLVTGTPVAGWTAGADGVRVETPSGGYRAERLVLCAGGWTAELLPELDLPLRIERQVNVWFRPRGEAAPFGPPHCPVYIWEYEPGGVLYGFPDLGEGVKAGLHHGGAQAAHPGAVEREVTDEEVATLRARLFRLLPGLADAPGRTATCFYTMTPDEAYLIDVHPAHPQVLFASACSGHGFKASPAVGEALADLVTEGRARVDVAGFGLSGRFAG